MALSRVLYNMYSSLESFSAEFFFEIFEYLSTYDLFQSFINLNDRFTRIIHSYPLHLNFQSISRLEFDYVCHHLQPEQVISLRLSDETIPNQINIFKKYFPLFQQQFIHLQYVTLIETFDEKLDLPTSVTFLEIRKYDTHKGVGFNFDQLLEQQANMLTHLKIDRIGLLNCIETPFPHLTHLIINGGDYFFEDCYIECNDQYQNIDATSIFQRIKSPITHLYLFIDPENPKMNINLQIFSHYLTHLTLHFFENSIQSFQSLEKYLHNLHKLTHLTLQTTGEYDLIDGHRWENYLVKTNISKFNFHFNINDFQLNESCLLQSFRSPFWLEKKHWYVGYYQNESTLFTVPRFQSKYIIYPSSRFPYSTTAPKNFEEKILYENPIELSIHMNEYILPPIHRFTQIKSLILSGSILSLSLDILHTIVNLNQIKELDISEIKHLSKHELDLLINVFPRLNSLIMKYHPLFVVPSSIHKIRFEGEHRSISINNLSHIIPNVKILEVPIQSTTEMLDIIDQLDHIDTFIFICDELSQGCYVEFFHKKLHMWSLQENSYRLRMYDFTYEIRDLCQEFRVSIGGLKTNIPIC